MNKTIIKFPTDKLNKESFDFASKLLIPKITLKRFMKAIGRKKLGIFFSIKKHKHLITDSELAKCFMCPEELVRYRRYNLGL